MSVMLVEDLRSEFSFSYICCFTSARELCQLYCLPYSIGEKTQNNRQLTKLLFRQFMTIDVIYDKPIYGHLILDL